MHIKCPHCSNPVELVESTAETASVTCPSCGSHFAILPETSPLTPSDYGSVSQFQLTQRVGRGHFGEVWKAWDETLGRFVALKLPRLAPGENSAEREYQEMFLREARSAARLRHPNIVPVHEVAQSPRGIIIVSDFIEGVNLAELISIKRPEWRRSAEIMRTVAQAVQHAHERGVIHRDLKPGNILIDNSGAPYVTDFGLAKREAAEITVTVDGQILGTPAYMPPEQARGKGHEADARSDIYSLGVMLYELLVGQRPFSGDQHLLIYQILNEEPARPRSHDTKIPKDLETICLRAMERNPEKRFQSATDLAAELDRYLRGEPIHSRPISSLERGWRWARRRPLVTALSLATGLSLLLFLGVAWAWHAIPRTETKIVTEEVVVAPPEIVTEISLDTEPSGAHVVFVPLSEFDGVWQTDQLIDAGVTPLQTKLKPGRYWVIAALDDQRFHEVYRDVPQPDAGPSTQGYRFGRYEWNAGVAKLAAIKIPTPDVQDSMIVFAGHERFPLGSDANPDIKLAPLHHVAVRPFLLEPKEFTAGDYRLVYPDSSPDALFGGAPPPSDEHPVVMLTWETAISLAEAAGKRLPEEAEYEFAATNEGRTRFPWGDADPEDATGWWDWSPVGSWKQDLLLLHPEVTGLFSGVGEWTSTPGVFYPGSPFPHDEKAKHRRVVRGRYYSATYTNFPPQLEIPLGARTRYLESTDLSHQRIGLRLARSAKPRLIPKDFGGQVQ